MSLMIVRGNRSIRFPLRGERRRLMCCDASEGAASTVDRRKLILGAAGTLAAGGLARTLAWPEAALASGGGGTLPAPKPIPGVLAPEAPIHIFLPGPETVTLPFSGLKLQGLNVEPSTITDFRGVTALAMVAGSATGSDGETYNLEADVRAFEGRYEGADGTRHRGTFALI
jgi:hypothetical protein